MYYVYNVSYSYLSYFACTLLSEETKGDGEKKMKNVVDGRITQYKWIIYV